MATLEQLFDTLRGRFLRARGRRSTAEVAEAIGITRVTLVRFLRGGTSTTTTLATIERWVDDEEARGLHKGDRHD